MTKPLTLSPSLYKRYLTCPAQAAYSLHGIIGGLKSSTGAALGRIAHKVVEMSSNMERNLNEAELIEWFDLNWEQYVSDTYQEMQREWFPNQVLKPTAWKGYFKARIAARTLVIKNSSLLPPRHHNLGIENPSAYQTSNFLQLPLVERHLTNEILRISGTPDYVFDDQGVITIFDYKFGMDQAVIKNHTMQLHFYIILLESLLNVVVTRCAIVASANRTFEVEIDREYLQELKDDIPHALQVLESNRAQAKPLFESCLFCPFKLECLSFIKSRFETPSGYPLAILGKIVSVTLIAIEFQEIEIISVGPGGEGVVKVFGIPVYYKLQAGDRVRIGNNLLFHSESLVQFQWNSLLKLEEKN